MDIGKKIKELRSAKLMTQTELAGHEITRNMLSRIENGAALPSVGTVIYLSERLGVHPGVLLSDGDDDKLFVKNNLLKNIKRAFLDKNFSLCHDMCIELLSYGDDDETYLIITEATFECAQMMLLEGNLHKCKNLLDEAISYSGKTIYNTNIIYSCAKNLFYHLKKISPSLDSDNIDTHKIDDCTRGIALSNSLCAYLNDLSAIKEGNILGEPGIYNNQSVFSKLYKNHVTAKLCMKNSEFQRALDILLDVINSSEIVPTFIVYLLSIDIEICAKEIGDFKTAYEYSQNRISLLESMLSEV